MEITCNVGTATPLIHLYMYIYIGIVEWPARCIHRNTLFLCVGLVGILNVIHII